MSPLTETSYMVLKSLVDSLERNVPALKVLGKPIEHLSKIIILLYAG